MNTSPRISSSQKVGRIKCRFLSLRRAVCVTVGLCGFVFGQSLRAANPSATLDEAQNGALNSGFDAATISPVDWASGNQNASKSHYIEGQAVPYRIVLENLDTSIQ